MTCANAAGLIRLQVDWHAAEPSSDNDDNSTDSPPDVEVDSSASIREANALQDDDLRDKADESALDAEEMLSVLSELQEQRELQTKLKAQQLQLQQLDALLRAKQQENVSVCHGVHALSDISGAPGGRGGIPTGTAG